MTRDRREPYSDPHARQCMPHETQERKGSHMLDVVQKTLGSLAIALTMLLSTPVDARQQLETQTQTQERPVVRRRIPDAARKGAVPFVRTELFFGTARPDGVVTEEEFRSFVDLEVTRRFPDGLTVLKGDGQFRGQDNVIIKETSFVLILLYPYDGFEKSSQRIQRIRDLYKEQFGQESVLRVDDPYLVWVSF
jgi:hypothetical protein